MKRDDYVTASEIGDYVFCKRGWWLKRNGMLPDTSPVLAAGIQAHETMVKQLLNNKRDTKIAIFLIGFGIVLVIVIIAMVFLHISW